MGRFVLGFWIPACAGMTVGVDGLRGWVGWPAPFCPRVLGSRPRIGVRGRPRGNDGVLCFSLGSRIRGNDIEGLSEPQITQIFADGL